MSDHLVLVGMGVGEPTRADRLDDLARSQNASVAYLQLGDPSLSYELTRLADLGASRVVLVGVAFGAGPGNSWLRRVASHWWRARGEARPEIAVATGLLATEGDLPRLLTGPRPLTGAEAALTCTSWEEIPRHRHQVFVCRGPRCTAQGAEDTAVALGRALASAGLGEQDVLVTQTGCQFPCNHAPVVSVQPDDVWYGQVGAEEAGAIVMQHLKGGEPWAANRLRRGGGS